MYDFHGNKSRYFDIQSWVTEKYIIPFLHLPMTQSCMYLRWGAVKPSA